jgi:hypothetical protein
VQWLLQLVTSGAAQHRHRLQAMFEFAPLRLAKSESHEDVRHAR